MKPYYDLANAIVAQAAHDYKSVLFYHKKHPDKSEYIQAIEDLESFFHSDWYALLTNLDENCILSRIRKEVLG